MGKETERVAAEVPSELKQEIRMEAARQGESMAALVREVLTDEFGEPESDDNTSDGGGDDFGVQAATCD